MHQALQQCFRLIISNPCSLKSEKVSPSHRSRAAAGAVFVHSPCFLRSNVDLGLGCSLSLKFIYYLGQNVSDRLAVRETDILT